MKYRAVIFDAFGTILKVQAGVHPYRSLLREGVQRGRRPRADDALRIMTFNGSLSECAEHLEVPIRQHRLEEIEAALEQEVAAIEAFPDALAAIALLQQHQLKVGVCSNLAQPYRKAVKRHFPELDAYTFSFEVGAVKADPLIYDSACESLGVGLNSLSPISDRRRVVMIGDSLRCDCHGPQAVGIRGVHLDRSPGGQISDLMDFAKRVIDERLERDGRDV